MDNEGVARDGFVIAAARDWHADSADCDSQHLVRYLQRMDLFMHMISMGLLHTSCCSHAIGILSLPTLKSKRSAFTRAKGCQSCIGCKVHETLPGERTQLQK